MLACFVSLVVGYLCIHRPPLLCSDKDAPHYLSLATHLASGAGYQSGYHYFHDLLQPPLYPLLVAFGIKLGASAVRSAMWVCLLAQMVTVIAAAGIHRQLWGLR